MIPSLGLSYPTGGTLYELPNYQVSEPEVAYPCGSCPLSPFVLRIMRFSGG